MDPYLADEEGKQILVMVIRDLLNLWKSRKGKITRLLLQVTSCMLWSVPKILRAHWKFLKTVVNKLFEFMHETHPGVQDMACDTFLKIVQKCKRKFVIVQVGESEPFVSELLAAYQQLLLILSHIRFIHFMNLLAI
ncbi:hypothetical protein BDE02_13G082000 [Populus trichocarpa]|nr:hypothetical protein BDE02_13G082000 [Populus trichocarpa]